MSASFNSPPSASAASTIAQPLSTDPALTARTFRNNPTLHAALARIQTRASTLAQHMPANETTFAHLYQVHTETVSGAKCEIITVPADDIISAIQTAVAQLVDKHADGIRVVSCRELKARSAA